MSEQKWLSLFEGFIKELRISSKEVPSIDERGAPLDLWGSQRIALQELCEGMENNVRTFLYLKSRQLGISTIFLGIDIFWLCVHPGTIGALVTDTEGNRAVFRETIERYIASFPRKYLGKNFSIVRSNKDFILFSNGSRFDLIVAGTKNKKNWGEGRGYALAHLTETAAYGSSEGLASFRETLADTNPNRLFIYESTAKGMNHYKDMWDEFGRDKFTKKRVFIGWWAKEINSIKKNDPRYEVYGVAEPDGVERELIEAVKNQYRFEVSREQLAWYRWRSADQSSSDGDIKQNQPWTAEEAFVMSGTSFFQLRVLQKDLEGAKDINFKGYRYWMDTDFWSTRLEQIVDQDRIEEVELRVWEEPVEGATYVIGCDPAYGRNDWKDRHCCSVWRCFADRLVQVAEYADNKVETRHCAWVLAHLAGAYRNCVVNVEITGPGAVILTEFEHLREIMKMNNDRAEDTEVKKQGDKWDEFLMNARWYLYQRPDSYGSSRFKCWQTTFNTKFQIMNQIRDNYATGLVVTNSAHLIEEMMMVVQDGSSIGAPGRQKDDRVFAMALANRVWIDNIRMSMIGRNETYQRVMESGYEEVDKESEFMQNVVGRFFKQAEALAENPELTEEEQWMSDRGFV